jgi:acyl dehydratase/NAD(P)-dependent dehydrogenase (short-subunit alcohol dehydrogenase family)
MAGGGIASSDLPTSPDGFSLTREQIRRFAAASGDRNPLHTSEEYARDTPFRAPIAHGVLGLLVAVGLARVDLSDVASVSARFHAPMFPGIRYRVVSTTTSDGAAEITVMDGRRPILVATCHRASLIHSRSVTSAEPAFPTGESLSAERSTDAGPLVDGPYWPDVPSLQDLMAELGASSIPEWALPVLSTITYSVGMLFPGRQALLRAFSVSMPAHVEGPVTITITPPTSASVRRGLGRISATVKSEGTQWDFTASAAIRPVQAPPPPQPRRDGTLSSSSAIVVGASRGLGASLSDEFRARGCTTWSLQRSATPGSLVSEGGGGRTLLADASDAESLAAARAEIHAHTTAVDYLVLNATGSLQSMWLDEAHQARISSYLAAETALLLVPLTQLISMVRPGGLCVYISSAVLDQTGDSAAGDGLEWPHYSAAKAAGEAIVRVAAMQYPWVRFVVVRLPRLGTSLTTTSSIASVEKTDQIAAELIDAWSRDAPSRFDAFVHEPAQQGTTP